MPNDDAKTKPITIKMTAPELARTKAIAQHYGLSMSAAIKMLLKNQARELGLEGG
jgi:antitoxin component of RelBE/YafQ-DinJ toxin-antitoxin module